MDARPVFVCWQPEWLGKKYSFAYRLQEKPAFSNDNGEASYDHDNLLGVY